MSGIQLLLVVVGAIAVTALANRRGLQPSLVVLVLAAAVSFIPGLPRFELPPELILGVVLPPLLFSAALDFSVFSFIRNLRPILSLGVALVLLSTLVTGAVAWWIVPGLALAPALVLGAVLAPTDAVAALAVGKQLGLPKRLMSILTGESLVNDAAALTFFTLAVAAVTGAPTFISNPWLLFGYEVVVGVVLGLVMGAVLHWVRLRLRDAGLETAFSLVVPFAAYLLAEQLHASGVLAVVFAGFSLGHNEAEVGYGTRMRSRQVWKSMDVVLEAFVFAYMGLQCRFVFDDLRHAQVPLLEFVGIAVVLLLVVLLVRPLWVFVTYGNNAIVRRWTRSFVARKVRERNAQMRAHGMPEMQPDPPLPWKYVTVISWSGMRGVVTLAAAAGVPALAGGLPFPQRSMIQALAFVIAVGTLVIQTPTLPWLIRWLAIDAPQEQEAEAVANHKAREIAHAATQETLKKVMAEPPEGLDPAMLKRFADQFARAAADRRKAEEADDEVDRAARNHTIREVVGEIRQQMLAAQRTALVKARDNRELDDEVMRRQLARLDYEEAAAAGEVS